MIIRKIEETINQEIPKINSQLEQKAKQIDLEKTNSNVTNVNTRIDNLILESGDSNIEVNDSHLSAIKSKTFANIKNRFEEIEADTFINIKNICKNSDFTNGLNDWYYNGVSTPVVLDNEVSFKSTTLGGHIRNYLNVISSHVYYFKISLKASSKNVFVEIAKNTSPYTVLLPKQYHSGFGEYETITGIFTANETSGDFVIRVGDNSTSSWQNVNVKYLSVIDLSNTFGSDIPNITEMNGIMSIYKNMWVNSVNLLNPKQVTFQAKTIINNKNISDKVKDLITINVKNYGAKGDGVTNDTLAIEKAISNLTDGGILFFPIGTYMVKNIALKSNIVVKGCGKYSVIKLLGGINSGQANCLSINNSQNIEIKDLTLDGNRLNNVTTGISADSNFNGIFISQSSDIKIENIWSHSNGYHGCIMSKVERITITHSKFSDNGYRPFHGHGLIKNCEFSFNECIENGQGFGGETGNPYDGIFFFDGATNLVITGNRIIASGTVACIDIGGSMQYTNPSKNISISNNLCSSVTSLNHGIQLIGENLSNVKIEGNIITNCLSGIKGSADFNTIGSNFVITNNIITDNAGAGIELRKQIKESVISNNTIKNNGTNGIVCIDLVETNLSNNVLVDNSKNRNNIYEAIVIANSVRNILVNNIIKNSVIGEFQSYGIRELTGCNSNLIKDNQIHQIQNPTSRVGSNSIIKDNMIDGVFIA